MVLMIERFLNWMHDEKSEIDEDTLNIIRSLEELYDDYLNRTGFDIDLEFTDDVIGKVFTSIGCKRDYTMRTCLYGTKGTIIVDNTSPELTLYLEKEDNHFIRYIELPLYYWLPLLPVCFLIQFGCCVWDGGLKEFSFSDLSRHIHHEAIPQWETVPYKKCEEIYKEKIK